MVEQETATVAIDKISARYSIYRGLQRSRTEAFQDFNFKDKHRESIIER
jgi:hypothetical protein